SLNLLYNAWIEGISFRQGGHQVAQKFINTTFPFKSAVFTTAPCSSLKVAETLTTFCAGAVVGVVVASGVVSLAALFLSALLLHAANRNTIMKKRPANLFLLILIFL